MFPRTTYGYIYGCDTSIQWNRTTTVTFDNIVWPQNIGYFTFGETKDEPKKEPPTPIDQSAILSILREDS